MENDFDKKLIEIIEHYGVMKQLKYFQSEVFELNEAIIEKEIGNYPDIKEKEHIAEEIADVMVMLSQFKEYYRIDGKDIMKIMNEKIDRQIVRINDEMENNE